MLEIGYGGKIWVLTLFVLHLSLMDSNRVKYIIVYMRKGVDDAERVDAWERNGRIVALV